MGSVKLGIGFGLWQQGMPDALSLFDDLDKAAAWGIDSAWVSGLTRGKCTKTLRHLFPATEAPTRTNDRMQRCRNCSRMPKDHAALC
jgi:hypothetical protein